MQAAGCNSRNAPSPARLVNLDPATFEEVEICCNIDRHVYHAVHTHYAVVDDALSPDLPPGVELECSSGARMRRRPSTHRHFIRARYR
jgi:hypothetical protein